MKKIILPIVLSSLFILSSCGFGNEIDKETYFNSINKISEKTFTSVNVTLDLQSRNNDIESTIITNYVYTNNGGNISVDTPNDLSLKIVDYLSCLIKEDYENSLTSSDAKYFIKDNNSGYSLAYTNTLKSEDHDIGSLKRELQYNKFGYYTNVFELEEFNFDNKNYVNRLNIKFDWKF